MAWQCFCGFALKTYGHYEESKKTALPGESVYDVAKCGSEAGKLALEYLCWGRFFRVFWCGLVMAEMGSTTKVIFLTHGQAGVCFWLFFQEQEWTLQCIHTLSPVLHQYPDGRMELGVVGDHGTVSSCM